MKKRIMKKVLGAVLAMTMGAMLLAGCGLPFSRSVNCRIV